MSASPCTPADSALLIIDMISDWRFEDADKLLPRACEMADAIATLKQRCKKAGMAVIYANDNHGHWRSDFQACVREAEESHEAAAYIGRRLKPEEDDYLILKPKHSAFLATPLHIVLSHLQVKKLLITGVTTDQCVLITAAEAKMNDFEVWCPSDCVATLSDVRQRRTLDHMEEVLKLHTEASATLVLPLGTGGGAVLGPMGSPQEAMAPGDQAPEGAPGTGEAPCPRCGA